MRTYLYIICICICGVLKAQQTAQYTQFTLYKSGYSPAASGTSLKSPLEAMIGTRRQWLDMPNAPKSNFFLINYTFIPKRSYRKWHNIGALVEQEQVGVFVNNGFYVSYTFHLLLTKKLTASFGVYAGARRFSVSLNSLDRNDPVVMRSAGVAYAYPDIIPGLRLYNKKMFLDFSIKQVSTPEAGSGSRYIGDHSRLSPTYYISGGRKFFPGNGLCIIPAFNLHGIFTGPPSAEVNLMVNYRSRVGVGASLRGRSFLCGIVQFRFLKNATVGIAYDYSINKMNAAAANSVEFMIGVTPQFDFQDQSSRKNVAKCPDLAF